MLSSGELRVRRQTQQKVWLWNLIQENALRHFQQHPAVHAELPELERRVTCGDISPGLAADLLLKVYSTVQWWKAVPREAIRRGLFERYNRKIESYNIWFLLIVFNLVLKDFNNWWHLIIMISEITVSVLSWKVGEIVFKEKEIKWLITFTPFDLKSVTCMGPNNKIFLCLIFMLFCCCCFFYLPANIYTDLIK